MKPMSYSEDPHFLLAPKLGQLELGTSNGQESGSHDHQAWVEAAGFILRGSEEHVGRETQHRAGPAGAQSTGVGVVPNSG